MHTPLSPPPSRNRTLLGGLRACYGVTALFILVIYGVTHWGNPPWDTWLYELTEESGPFEMASAGLLVVMGCWCLYLVTAQRSCFTILETGGLLVLGILGIAGAGEEVSWGHHWFDYQPSAFFIENNLQQETNLHNFIPAERFSFIIGLFTYIPFLFLPIGYHLAPHSKPFQLLDTLQLRHLMPGVNCALMMLFANLNQAWLLPVTYPDNIAAGLALVLAGALLLKLGQHATRAQWAMWIYCVIFFGLCLLLAPVFRHNNTQYEIRECLMIFVIGYWLLDWTLQRLTIQHAQQTHSPTTTMD